MPPPPPSLLRTSASWRNGIAALALVLIHGLLWATPREVRLGVYQNEPKIFLDTATQQPSGIFGDLAYALAKQEDWTLTVVPCTWQACLDGLKNGSIDLMPDVAYTPERADIFDFHATPALLSWSQIYARPGITVRSALDLNGLRIAVLQGSVQQDYLRSLLSGFGLSATLVPVQNLEQAMALATRGEVDAAVANRFYGDLNAPRYQLTPTPVLFQPAQLFFATGKDRNPDLLAAVEQHMRAWQAEPNSHYYAIVKRWMTVNPQSAIPAEVWWLLGGLCGVLALVLGAWWLLRREVAEKTRKLQASEERLNTILDSVDAYIYIKDTELRYQYANRKVCELFGRAQNDVLGQTDERFFDAQTVGLLRANDLRVVRDGERVEAEEHNRNAHNNEEHTYLSVKLPLHRPDGSIYALCGISTDITRQKQSERAIHQLAFYDPLTRLPNRRLLMERLHQALAARQRSGECGALLFIDIDNFKDLNDTLGHSVGDLLLSEMATRLASCTRAQDTLARQGGDEFVAILEGLGPSVEEASVHAQHVADKILRTLSQPYTLGEHPYQTTVSIGVVLFSDDQQSQDELLQRADLAMYQAKADGRNTVRFFNPQMQARVNARTALETDLHRALQEQQFVLYYQPQVDADGHTLGAEALVRWQHPHRGLVSPAEFIPVAEASGLILPLGRWIVETACRQLVAWADHPDTRERSIAVNISARQFRQSGFVSEIMGILQATGANPQRLELELTESQLLDDLNGVILKMDALKALGLQFALDDFGTGYSSLNVLKRLPLDQLKIDKSFVQDLPQESSSASIVRAIITLGDSLGLQVIAEGVETGEQRDALLSMGCSHFQGYLFGRPAPMRS